MKRKILLLLTCISICIMGSARQPQKGYRGFFDWSNSLRSQKVGLIYDADNIVAYNRQNLFYTGFSTTHGYQINQKFFVGVGFSVEQCSKTDNWLLPVFATGRMDMKFGKFTPFGEVRLGANLTNGGGVYFSPSIGYRFNWGRKFAINLGAGLSLLGYKVMMYDIVEPFPNYYDIIYVGTEHHVRPYFTFKIGIEI